VPELEIPSILNGLILGQGMGSQIQILQAFITRQGGQPELKDQIAPWCRILVTTGRRCGSQSLAFKWRENRTHGISIACLVAWQIVKVRFPSVWLISIPPRSSLVN
jgi:hypothetical protein